MSENNHKEWAPGLVALYVGPGNRNDELMLRNSYDHHERVSWPKGNWCTDPPYVKWMPDSGWSGPVWVGTNEEYRALRERAETPADLLRIAREDVQTPKIDSTVVIFGERYVKASDSREALAQAEATIGTLRREMRDAQMLRDDSIQCYAAEADSARAEVRNLRSEIDRLRARMDDIPGLLAGVLGFRPYEITAEGLGGSPSSLPKGQGLVAYDIKTKYSDGRAITKATLACQK